MVKPVENLSLHSQPPPLSRPPLRASLLRIMYKISNTLLGTTYLTTPTNDTTNPLQPDSSSSKKEDKSQPGTSDTLKHFKSYSSMDTADLQSIPNFSNRIDASESEEESDCSIRTADLQSIPEYKEGSESEPEPCHARTNAKSSMPLGPSTSKHSKKTGKNQMRRKKKASTCKTGPFKKFHTKAGARGWIRSGNILLPNELPQNWEDWTIKDLKKIYAIVPPNQRLCVKIEGPEKQVVIFYPDSEVPQKTLGPSKNVIDFIDEFEIKSYSDISEDEEEDFAQKLLKKVLIDQSESNQPLSQELLTLIFELIKNAIPTYDKKKKKSLLSKIKKNLSKTFKQKPPKKYDSTLSLASKKSDTSIQSSISNFFRSEKGSASKSTIPKTFKKKHPEKYDSTLSLASKKSDTSIQSSISNFFRSEKGSASKSTIPKTFKKKHPEKYDSTLSLVSKKSDTSIQSSISNFFRSEKGSASKSTIPKTFKKKHPEKYDSTLSLVSKKSDTSIQSSISNFFRSKKGSASKLKIPTTFKQNDSKKQKSSAPFSSNTV